MFHHFIRLRIEVRSVDLGSSLVEFVALDVLYKAVELLLGVFILVSLPGHSDSDLARHVSDALEPNVSVQLGVDANVLRDMRKNNQLGNNIVNISNGHRALLFHAYWSYRKAQK